ncbi:MAG TPA: radical SAM protein [Rhodocyclaceae bacterium]|nr:radical SAM protein [Rhodocyclaceae bacterium]
MLTTEDHSRDSANMRYIYPVVSRRAAGVSIGINLNPNNACNWRCVYCQVPDLKRGGPPPIDLLLLERELDDLLNRVLNGDFLATHAPAGSRRLVDVAFSGNGEPTSAAEFPQAVERVRAVLQKHHLAQRVPMRLITNGSMLDRPAVQAALRHFRDDKGEVWFKLDSATASGVQRINGSRVRPETVARRLACCARLATTWVQTCMFLFDGQAPSSDELEAYLKMLTPLAPRLAGVHLYGVARPSLQKEAPRLGRLSSQSLEDIARRIRQIGLAVQVSP